MDDKHERWDESKETFSLLSSFDIGEIADRDNEGDK